MTRCAKCGSPPERRIDVALLLFAVMVATGPAIAAGCADDCKRRFQSRIERCQLLFEDSGSSYYRNARWRATCRENARVEFDNCRAFC